METPIGFVPKAEDINLEGLDIDVDTVRNYFGGKHYDAKGNVGIHVEQGPDGGVVTLDDTTILDAAMRILNQQ